MRKKLSLSQIQDVYNELFVRKSIRLFIKRDDLLHPSISGNKWRKLKYNLLKAKSHSFHTLLTFGGAFSNHIAAVAAAGKEFGFRTIGIIRGEKISPLNATLSFAHNCGMHLKFITRSEYRDKYDPEIQAILKEEFGTFYLIPEGGTNCLALKGCKEIISEVKQQEIEPDYYCVACGTGGTISGIISALENEKKVLGFSALKGDFLNKEVSDLLEKCDRKTYSNWSISTDYHFGGYAKWKPPLIDFINDFFEETKIPLDPIYTGKMLYGIYDLVEKDYFEKGTTILAIHTGGLQGIRGFNDRFGNPIKI